MRIGFALTSMVYLVSILVGTPLYAADSVSKLKKKAGRLVQAGEVDQAISVVREIGASGDEDAIDALFAIGRVSPSEKFYDVVVEEMLRQDGVLTYMTEKFDKARKKFMDRVYAANVVSKIEGDEARAALVGFLDDKTTFVRSEVVRGLTATMHRDAIGPLIELLEDLSKKRRDVLYHEVRDALWELTGQDFDLVDDWKSWWEPNAGRFDPKSVKKEGGEGATGVRRKRRGEGDPDFFGVPVNSKNTLFIIDTSGSMSYVVRSDMRGLAKGDGSDGGAVQPPDEQPTAEDIRMHKFWTRMAVAKRELRSVLQQLKKDALFNMLNYDNKTYPPFNKRGAVPCNGKSRSKGFKWADALKLRPKSATCTLEALEAGFNLDGKINTIFLLSDGSPSKDGKVADPTQPILDKVFAMNKFRKIKIHTFGFNPITYPLDKGKQPFPPLVEANRFLKELADKTGGTFTIMEVDPTQTPDNPEGDKGKGKKKSVAEIVQPTPVLF